MEVFIIRDKKIEIFITLVKELILSVINSGFVQMNKELWLIYQLLKGFQ